MLKIGEFSKLTQVSIRMLRYYDEAHLLRPAQTDPSTGYRLYSAEQIPTLNKIVFLRDTGFSVAEIKEAMKDWSDEQVHRMLEKKQQEIRTAIEREHGRLNKIQLAMEDLQREKIAFHCSVSIKQIPSRNVISLRRRIADYFAEGFLWKELAQFTTSQNITTTPSTFAIYHDREFKDSDVDVEVCDAVENFHQLKEQHPSLPEGIALRQTEPVEHMACSMVLGPFENIAPASYAFAAWLQTHNEYEMAGKSRQTVHIGPWNADSPEGYITEIQFELRKK